MRISVIGLGNMGPPIAANLLKAGFFALLVALLVALISVRKINQPLAALIDMARDWEAVYPDAT